jgi:hypothetical protein
MLSLGKTKLLLMALALALALPAMGPGSKTAYASEASAPSATAAVQAIIHPWLRAVNGVGACTLGERYRGCPLSEALRRRLLTVRLPFNILCRCQNTALRVDIGSQMRLRARDGRPIIQVRTRWVFGPQTIQRITFGVEIARGTFVVFDSYCTGNSSRPVISTTIFGTSPPPCR